MPGFHAGNCHAADSAALHRAVPPVQRHGRQASRGVENAPMREARAAVSGSSIRVTSTEDRDRLLCADLRQTRLVILSSWHSHKLFSAGGFRALIRGFGTSGANGHVPGEGRLLHTASAHCGGAYARDGSVRFADGFSPFLLEGSDARQSLAPRIPSAPQLRLQGGNGLHERRQRRGLAVFLRRIKAPQWA